jgi:hypothetical protein
MSNITEKSTQEIVWIIVNNLDFEKREICSVEILTGIKFITWTQVIFPIPKQVDFRFSLPTFWRIRFLHICSRNQEVEI